MIRRFCDNCDSAIPAAGDMTVPTYPIVLGTPPLIELMAAGGARPDVCRYCYDAINAALRDRRAP